MQERAQHKSLVRRHRYTGGGRVAAVSLPIRFQQGVTWDRARDLRTPRGGVYLGGHDALPEGASELHVIIEAMVLEGFQRVSAVGENGHSGFLGAAGSRIRCGAMSKVSTQLTFNEGCGHAPISVMQQFDNSKGAHSHRSLAGSRAKSKRLLLLPRRNSQQNGGTLPMRTSHLQNTFSRTAATLNMPLYRMPTSKLLDVRYDRHVPVL